MQGNWIEKLQAEKELAGSIQERNGSFSGCPFNWGSINSWVLIEIDEQLKAAKKERDEYKEKYQQLCTNLVDIDSGFDNVIEKLVTFGRVWAAVRFPSVQCAALHI